MGRVVEKVRFRERVADHADAAYWRVRHWWMDTDMGAQVRITLLCVAVLLVILQLIRVTVEATMPAPPTEPVKAIYWWVVQLIILIVSAIISYALRPKPQEPKPEQFDSPIVEDGHSVLEVHGDVWIKEEFIGAQRVVGKEPIKQKGKK